VGKSLRDENFDQKNRDVESGNAILSAESLQSVRDNEETANQAVKQAASTHAAEAEITPADEDRDAKHFVLVNELENQAKMINQAELVADNQLISEKHNPLILDY
jgi:hypothetical protein